MNKPLMFMYLIYVLKHKNYSFLIFILSMMRNGRCILLFVLLLLS